ncbi:hypothetical protein ElyMa_000134100 [Elysia marginata]|uniref:REJ domain-containing protein n=1 Tax=Elysia marginata TaxID=1093978 RepID=A0AAV4EQX5_9GAST|nr:hypothetical protein ElyMa_000134100 [Elysia marginata]
MPSFLTISPSLSASSSLTYSPSPSPSISPTPSSSYSTTAPSASVSPPPNFVTSQIMAVVTNAGSNGIANNNMSTSGQSSAQVTPSSIVIEGGKRNLCIYKF